MASEAADNEGSEVLRADGLSASGSNRSSFSNEQEAQVKFYLPDKTICSLFVRPNANSDEVYAAIVEKIQLDAQLAPFFYLFEIIDESFERKLRPNELPYVVFAQNSVANFSSCIAMKKWYFNLRTEKLLAKNQTTLKYLFYQAVEYVERGQVALPDDSKLELKLLKKANNYLEYLKIVCKLDGYGETVFPHCACNSRKQGHVIVQVELGCVKLKACSREGELEPQVVEFASEQIESIDVDDEDMAFVLDIKIPDKPNKKIKIFSGFYLYMFDCVEKSMQEKSVLKKLDNKENTNMENQ